MLLETRGTHERRWKCYPAYRDSGVEWLGAVPENWQVERLRFHISINPTKSEVRRLAPDTPVSFIPMESVREYGGICLDQTRPIEDVSAGYTYFQEGDVVVAKITPCFENVKRAVVKGLTNGIGFGTTELHVLRPNYNINRYFLFYLTLSYDFRKLGESEMYGSAGQKRVPEEFIKNLKHPIPSLPEQRAIAAFLDRETGHIDALAAKKERLADLLEEKRTALISHAVTKGLDPDAPMKDSGIEWLGEVPVEWGAIPIKRLEKHAAYLAQTGPFGAQLHASDYTDDGVPLILIKHVNHLQIIDEDMPRVSIEKAEQLSTYRLEPGDIVFSRVGSVGRVALATDHESGWLISGQMLRLRIKNPKIHLPYLIYAISSSEVLRYFELVSVGSTRESINTDILRGMPTPIPPLPEQRAIAALLDRETTKIDALTKKIYEQIDKLKEYRTALISAAVTGKIDVRGEIP